MARWELKVAKQKTVDDVAKGRIMQKTVDDAAKGRGVYYDYVCKHHEHKRETAAFTNVTGKKQMKLNTIQDIDSDQEGDIFVPANCACIA